LTVNELQVGCGCRYHLFMSYSRVRVRRFNILN
jgi:hypothetical protein